jgi:hypothetical protein
MPQPPLLRRLAADLLHREAQRPDVQQSLSDKLASCLHELDHEVGNPAAYLRAAQLILHQALPLVQRETRRGVCASSPGPVYGPPPAPVRVPSPATAVPPPLVLDESPESTEGDASSESSGGLPALEGCETSDDEDAEADASNLTGARFIAMMHSSAVRQRMGSAPGPARQ